MSRIIGEVTPEERALIEKRDRLAAQFREAGSDAERQRLVAEMQNLTARFDASCVARREQQLWTILERSYFDVTG